MALTFHAVKNLPSDLDGSDNCGKTLVKENDILKANHAVRTTGCSNNMRKKAHTAALRAASEAP